MQYVNRGRCITNDKNARIPLANLQTKETELHNTLIILTNIHSCKTVKCDRYTDQETLLQE